MKPNDSDQSDSDNEGLINTGMLSVFRHRKRIDDDTKISEVLFQNLQESLTCPICLEIFSEAVYIKDCSHRFCKQCIEKYIRSQERKSCPTCRKKIGTKRQLRVDENILFLMQTVFGDVEQYRLDEENQRMLQLEEMRSDGRNLKKGRMTPSRNDDEYKPVSIQKKNIKKKICRETPDVVKPGETEDRDSPDTVEPQELDEDDLNKRLQVQMNEGVPFTITFQLLKYPESFWVRQIKENIMNMPWNINTRELASQVCKRLNLKYSEIGKHINFYVKQENRYESIEVGTTLESLNKNFWNYYRDIEVYNSVDILKKVVDKDRFYLGSKRILYYDIDAKVFDDLKP